MLAIEFSHGPLDIAYTETRNLGIKIAAVGMVLIALVGLGMGFVLTRRLQSLADAADRVAASDTCVRVEVSGMTRWRASAAPSTAWSIGWPTASRHWRLHEIA